MLREGTTAPEISATLDTGEAFHLSDYRGKKNVVLYFYPKDFTMGCTREACVFRDNYDDIKQYDAIIVGVSGDSADSHQRFRERHDLPFPLLPDTGRSIIRAYDSSGFLGIAAARTTYVIDKAGVIRSAFRHDFAVGKHLPKVLEALREIEPARAS